MTAFISERLDRQLKAFHENGVPVVRMAELTGLSRYLVERRLAELGLPPPPRAKRRPPEPRPKSDHAPPDDSPSIVDAAAQTLLLAGYTRRDLSLMSLDQRMLAANRIRAAHALPPLGRNPRWLP